MKSIKLFSLSLLFFLTFITSCTSTPEKNIDSVFVMIYDYENSGVMDADIYIDGHKKGATDVYGRFIFPTPIDKKKEYKVEIEKKGYEKTTLSTLLCDGQVLYFKIGNASYYANYAEKLYDDGMTDKALEMIDKALSIQDREDYRYLQKVIKNGVKNEKK